MPSVLEDQAAAVATALQEHADTLNALARHAQMHDMTEEEAADTALPMFKAVLEAAFVMGDEGYASAMLSEFRNRLVPSVIRAWDPWIAEAFPSMWYPPIRWIIAPDLT